MDKLQALYKSYQESGLLSSETTFDQFKSADESVRKSLYDQGVNNKILSVETGFDLFSSAWSEKKNQVDTLPLDFPEEVTESIIETETQDGVVDSLDQPPIEYLDSDFEELKKISTRTEVPSVFQSPASIRAKMLSEQNVEIDLNKKEKLLSDFNIKKSLEKKIIDQLIIDKALQGNKNAINKLEKIAVSNPEVYKNKIKTKNLDKPFAYEDKSQLVEIEGSDLDNMYNSESLKTIKGFNLKDFDGYLNDQGYKENYLELLNEETLAEDGRSFDYSGQYNPSLAAERLKLEYLTNYVNNQIERNVESQVLNYQLNNEGKNPSLDGIKLSYSSGIDEKALTNYIEKELPVITSKLKQRDVANQELYQDMKNGDVSAVGQAFKQGWRSVEDRLASFSAGTYDFIGMDSVADEIRMSQAETELNREDFMRYAYASGKKTTVNGTQYLVDDQNQIYDTDLGIRVTNVLTPNKSKQIYADVEKNGEESSSLSLTGGAIITTGIAADVVLQLGLQRGVGIAGKGLGAFTGAFDTGKKIQKLMSYVPMKATTASAMIAQGTLFSTNLSEQTRKQALEAGLSIEKAEELSVVAGQQGYLLGTLTAPLSTQTVTMDKIFGKKATEKIATEALETYQKGGITGLKGYWNKALQKAKIYGAEGGREVFQENVQQAGQAFSIAPNVNEIAGKEIMTNTISGDEYMNTTLLSLAAGILMPFAGDISTSAKTSFNNRFRPGVAARDKMNSLYTLSQDVDKTTDLLNSQVTKGLYTEKQVQEILKDIEVFRNTVNSIPTNLSPETSLSVMSDINEIKKQEELKKQRDPAFHESIDNKINELRNNIIKKTNFDYVTKKDKLKLKEEASKELIAEAEKKGEENFEINDSQITYRAIENFNKLTPEEQIEFTDIKLKEETDAIQEPSTKKQVLPDDAGSQKEGGDSEVGLQQVGEGDTEQVITETKVEESDTKTNQISDTTTQTDTEQLAVNVAPFFDTTIESTTEAAGLRKSPEYQQYKKNLIDLGTDLGLDIEIEEAVGGYENNSGKKIREISNVVKLKNATLQQASEYAALAAALAPEVQESSIAAEYVTDDTPGITGQEYILEVSDSEGTFQALKEVGIDEYTLNESNNSLTLFKFNDSTEVDVLNKLKSLKENLDGRNIQYTAKERASIRSEYITAKERKSFLTTLRRSLIEQGREGSNLYNKVLSAINREAESQTQPVSKEEGMSVKNKIESFANRIIEQEGTTDFSDDALQFYAENQESIDKAVAQKKKNIPKNKSKERALALKIARGDTDFSNADIDLYAASEKDVQSEVEAIGKTSNETITSETYKNILDSTKSTTRKDKAKQEGENVQRKKFWKSWNKSAREKKMDLKQKRKSLNDGIKAYAKKRKGIITAAQLRAVINKINNVNLDNPVQVKKVQEYSEKVFSDADFANDVNTAIKLSGQTRKKLNTGRLGDNGNFNAAVSQLLTLPISDLDPSDLKTYNQLLSQVSKRSKDTKLDNDLINQANNLLNTIKSKEIEVESEFEFNEIKQAFVYKEGTQKIIDKILDSDVSGETIIKENSDFIENKLDALDSATLEILVNKINSAETDENVDVVDSVNDYAKNRQSLIDKTVAKSKELKLNKLTKIAQDQSVGATTLQGLNTSQLALLTGKELSELDVHLDNISEGFYTYYANKIAQKIEGNNRAVNVAPMLDIMFSTGSKFSTARQYATASVKNSLVKSKGGSKAAQSVGIRGQMIRSNPLNVMDNLFGNYKNRNIYNNTIRPTAEAHAKFKNWINEQTDIIETAESLLAPTIKEKVSAAVKRRFELTVYLLQNEFESNSNKKGTAPGVEFIEGTIAKYNEAKGQSRYNEESINLLKQILKEYSVDGQISLSKMDKSMSPKTKKALKLLQGVYSGLGELQSYATRIVRGNELDLVNQYVHHKTDYTEEAIQDASAIEYLKVMPGTKSKTSFERKGVTAIDFDPISTVLRATKNTGLDYFMSNEISTNRQGLSTLKKITGSDASKTEKQNNQLNEAAIDLNLIYSEALENVITNNMSSSVIGGSWWNSVRTGGYYAALASIPRAGAELASNVAFAALSTPKETTLGITKYGDLSMSNKGRMIVENTPSTSATKLYNDEQLGGSKTDSQGVTKKKSSPIAKSELKENLEYIARATGVKGIPKAVGKVGEFLISRPDQMISRPLWFGTVASTFKSETGQNIDFDKIAENNSDYMKKYKEAIAVSTRKADENVTMAATSNDPFSQVLKNQAKQGEAGYNFYRMLNSYMSKFSLNEYATARQAVASIVGRGEMGSIRGVSTLAGVGVRMTMYVMMLRYLNSAMFGMLGIGDDEDDTDYAELGLRQAVGAATSLISRGMSGNIPMIPLNFTIEALNKDYGYEAGLRSNKEYTYEDALIYATINPSNASRNLPEATLYQLSGPLNPYAKTLSRAFTLGIRSKYNKTDESRQKNLEKLFSARTAIEIANIFGGVPFYRDIRKGFIEEQYKGSKDKAPNLKLLKKIDPIEYKRQMRLKKQYQNSPEYKRLQRIKKKERKIKASL